MITGVNGFVGHHLTRELKNQNFKVIGVGLQASTAPALAQLLDDYFSVDLTNLAQVAKLPLANVDAIINLAGLANVSQSFDQPQLYMKVNTAVLKTLAENLLRNKLFNTRLLAISTGSVYDPAEKMPLHEDSKLASDASPYVKSKIAMEAAGQEFISRGLDIVILRPFNHIGPGQEPGFLLPDLLGQIRRAVAEGEVVKVGNLKTKRDYTDVRDVVKAYAGLAHAESLKYRVYNICSGKSVAGQEILDQLMALTGISVKVKPDPALMRPNDNPELYGSFQRLHAETGWQPQIPLKKTIKDFLKAASF